MTLAARVWGWATAEHFAQLGVIGLLLALIRIPAEVLRLGAAAPVSALMEAEIIAAVFCLLAGLLLFCRRPRSSIITAVAGVAALIAFKFWQLQSLG